MFTKQRTIDERVAILKSRYDGRSDAFNIDKTPYDQMSPDPNIKVKKQEWLNIDKATDQRIPLLDEDFEKHINGTAPIAMFQKLVDDTIKFAVVDFDYPWDYSHVVEVQTFVWKTLGVPCYMAKSSRKGWHLTFFFKTWIDFKLFTSFWVYVVQETTIDRMVMSEEYSSDGRFYQYPEVFPRPGSYGDQDPVSLSCGAIKLPMVEPRVALGFNAFHKEFEMQPFCVPDQWDYLAKTQQIDPVEFAKKLEELNIEVVAPTTRRKRVEPRTDSEKGGAVLHDKEQKPKGSFLKVLKGCPALREAYDFKGRHSHYQRLALGIIAANCMDGPEHIMKLCETNPEHWQKEETEKAMKYLAGRYAPYTCERLQLLGVCHKGLHPVKGENKDHCLEPRDVEGEKIPPSPYRFAVQRSAKEDVTFDKLKTEVMAARELIEGAARRGHRPGTQEYDSAFAKYKEALIDGYLKANYLQAHHEQQTIRTFLDSQDVSKAALKDIKTEAKARMRTDVLTGMESKYEFILGSPYEEAESGYVRHYVNDKGLETVEQLTNFAVVFGEEIEHRKNLYSTAAAEDRLISGHIRFSDGKKVPFKDISLKLMEGRQMKPLIEKLSIIAGPQIEYLDKKIGEIRNCISRFGYKKRKAVIKKTVIVEDAGWNNDIYITSNALVDKNGIMFADGDSLQIPNSTTFVKMATNNWDALAFTVKSQLGNAPRFTKVTGDEFRALLKHYVEQFLAWHKPEVTYVMSGHGMAAALQKFFPKEIQGIAPTLYVVGLFGSGKTETARAIAKHYGRYEQMFNWQNSPKSLTDNLWIFRDMVVWIDNYKKAFAKEAVVSKVVHLSYERHARGGQKQDGTARPAKPCAGLCIITGEDVFQGDPSTASRCLFVKFNEYNLTASNEEKFLSVKENQDKYSSITAHLIHFALGLPSDYWENSYRDAISRFKPLTENYPDNAERVLKSISMVYMSVRALLKMCNEQFMVIDESGLKTHLENLESACKNVMADTLVKIGSDDSGITFLEDIRALLASNPNKFYIEGTGVRPNNNVATRIGFITKEGHVALFKEALKSVMKEFPDRSFQSIDTIAQALLEKEHIADSTACIKPFAHRRFHDPDTLIEIQRQVLIVKRASLFPPELPPIPVPEA